MMTPTPFLDFATHPTRNDWSVVADLLAEADEDPHANRPQAGGRAPR